MRNARNIGAELPKDHFNTRILDVGQLVTELYELVEPFFEKQAPLFCCADDNTQNLNFAVWGKDFVCLADTIGHQVLFNTFVQSQKGGFVAN